jgi:hypothetical protein
MEGEHWERAGQHFQQSHDLEIPRVKLVANFDPRSGAADERPDADLIRLAGHLALNPARAWRDVVQCRDRKRQAFRERLAANRPRPFAHKRTAELVRPSAAVQSR